MSNLINGTWFEFQHHNKAEGKYWNERYKNFTADDWRNTIDDIKKSGMEYIVLLATALYDEAYYKTNIFPQASLKCENPMEVLLSQADKNNMKVFISAGFYGDWTRPDINMVDPIVTKRGLQAMNEIAELYGNHQSLYGWYFPDELWIRPYFSEDFISYVNTYAKEAHKLCKNYKTLVAPYGTREAACDDIYINQIERIDADFFAYQDEVGAQKSMVHETAAFYERLKKAHDKAARGKLWADVELFEFEGEVLDSPLIPADSKRIKMQLDAVSPYVEKILVYQHQIDELLISQINNG